MKTLLCVVALALVAVLASLAPAEAQSRPKWVKKLEELHKKARKADEDGDYKQAVEYFKEGAEAIPEGMVHSQVYNNIGVASMRYASWLASKRRKALSKRTFDEALEAFRTALDVAQTPNKMAAENFRDVLQVIHQEHGIDPDDEDLELLDTYGLVFKPLPPLPQGGPNGPGEGEEEEGEGGPAETYAQQKRRAVQERWERLDQEHDEGGDAEEFGNVHDEI